MKKFLLTLLAISPLMALQWMDNYQQAAAKAQAENKPMVLFFQGSDWCGPCKSLKKNILSQPEFANKVGNQFVWVEVDFPQGKKLPSAVAQQNDDLKRRYGITGLPTLVIVNPQGLEIGRLGSSQESPSQYADRLQRIRSRNHTSQAEVAEELF